MPKPEIDGFDNRGSATHPFGFIVFTDGLRVGYAPNTDGSDEDGLFDAQQPYSLAIRNKRVTPTHNSVARTWAKALNIQLAALAEQATEREAAVAERKASE